MSHLSSEYMWMANMHVYIKLITGSVSEIPSFFCSFNNLVVKLPLILSLKKGGKFTQTHSYIYTRIHHMYTDRCTLYVKLLGYLNQTWMRRAGRRSPKSVIWNETEETSGLLLFWSCGKNVSVTHRDAICHIGIESTFPRGILDSLRS